jgi:hypothetical protein
VIGVNTAIYSPSGGNVGIAFDIMMVDFAIVVRPKDTRREFLPQPGVSIIRAASQGAGVLNFHQALVLQLRRRERCLFLLVTVSSPIVRRRGLKVANWAVLGFGRFSFHGRAFGLFTAICF